VPGKSRAQASIVVASATSPARRRDRGPTCSTLFHPADAALPWLRPAESGDFVVGAKQTVTLTRQFRVVDPD